MKAGAASALACDIDPFAETAIRLNAAANAVSLRTATADPMSANSNDWDLILAGDVFYEQPMAGQVLAWLKRQAARCPVLIGDPKRTYFPYDAARHLASYSVPTTTEIEDSDLRATSVWSLRH
jgi:predicted nicotinamide N-methyase